MVFLKILPLLIPIFFFLIPIFTKRYLKFLFTKKKTPRDDLMMACDTCGTYTHESIIIKKRGKNFCSDACSNA